MQGNRKHYRQHRHLTHLLLTWSLALLLFLTACGGGSTPDFSQQEGVEVNIFSNLGRTTSSADSADLGAQGVPVDPETGETGVVRAELEVYSGDTRLFFRDGRIVAEAEGEAVVLTPEDSDVTLALPEGRYRFTLSASDGAGNTLARGEAEQQVGEESRVSVPLTSLVGSARFEVPASVKANEVFDAFLRVSPPNRPDLRVPLGDYTVSYEVAEPGVQLGGSSNLGVRVAAACEVVEVSAAVSNDLSEEVTASASVPVNDEACDDANDTPVGADLVPPFVVITTPEAGSTVNKSFTVQGDVNDRQSGVEKVEVYEGTLKLGDANLDSDAMSWRFDASLDNGSYTLTAVAFDKAGNTSRAEARVTVQEGAGGGAESCTNPVSVPDENLRRALKETLGLSEEDEITCEMLAELEEFFRGGTDENDNPVEFSTLEGLQFATNLEVIDIKDSVIRDFSAIATLTKLERLNLNRIATPSLAPLRNLTTLTELEVFGRFLTDGNLVAEDVDALAGLVNLETLSLLFLKLSDISALEGLEKLNRLSLTDNNISDLSPLVSNEGLGEGDTVFLQDNPLDLCPGTEDRADIEALIKRGVDVVFDEPTDCDTDGEEDQTCTSPVNVPDENLRSALRNALELDEGEAITCEALAGLTTFVFSDDSESRDEFTDISTLEGLQFAVNLETLIVDGAVINYDAIAGLTKLKRLNLFVAAPSLEPLRNLTALTELSLSSDDGLIAEDEDALAGLVNLERLLISNYGSGDLTPVQNLTKLTELFLLSGDIRDLTPLQNLTQLRQLDLRNNQITDLSPLVEGEGADLPLAYINLLFNPIETCPGTQGRADIDALTLRGVEVLFEQPENCDYGGGDGQENCTNPVNIPDESLRAALKDALALSQDAEVTCASLANLTIFNPSLYADEIKNLEGLQFAPNLRSLNLASDLTSEAFAPLEDLTKLQRLFINVSVTGDTDLSFLENLVNLESLSLSPRGTPDYGGLQPEVDISPLRNLTKLTALSLSYLNISDMGPLQDLTGLNALSLDGNEISDIGPLQNLTSLVTLFLNGNEISDLSALQNLSNLRLLNLFGNNISDIGPLVANVGLAEGDEVNLNDNPLSDQAFDDIETLRERGVSV